MIETENSTVELVLSKEKVHEAIVKFENTQREHWSYSISRYENEEGDITSSIEQYSPRAYSKNGETWLLKQINGEEPTPKQVKNFAEKKHSDENKTNIKLKLRDLINQESLSLVSSDENSIVMAFNVQLKKLGKDSVGKLQGNLIYQKDKEYIEKISIWNNAEFSPMFTANITDLAITFTFVEIDGAVLAKENEMKMKGRFAYFTEINETSLDRFSGYQYLGK
jgi:hypothetical protein